MVRLISKLATEETTDGKRIKIKRNKINSLVNWLTHCLIAVFIYDDSGLFVMTLLK